MNHTTLCVRLFAGMLFALFASCTKESASEITKLDELQTARFAVVTGTIADKLVLQGLPNATFAYYNSPLDACIAVQKGIEVVAAYDEPILRNIMAQSLDLKLEIVNMEFGSLIASLLSGKTDIIGACMTITEERAKTVLFTDPYYQGGIAAVIRDGANEPPLTKDLTTATFGAMTGTTGEMYIRANFPEATVLCFDDIMDGIASLQAQKLDYVITAYTTALKAASKNPNLEVLPEEYTHEYAAIAFAKSNAHN